MRQWLMVVKARKFYRASLLYKKDFNRLASLALGKLRLNMMQRKTDQRRVRVVQNTRSLNYLKLWHQSTQTL